VKITKPFYLSVFEVTQEQYELVMDEKPSFFSETGAGRVSDQDTPRHPVETVFWFNAITFYNKLSVLEGVACRIRASYSHLFKRYFMKTLARIAVIAIAQSMCCLSSATAGVIYSNDFERVVGTEWSKTTTAVTPVISRQ